MDHPTWGAFPTDDDFVRSPYPTGSGPLPTLGAPPLPSASPNAHMPDHGDDWSDNFVTINDDIFDDDVPSHVDSTESSAEESTSSDLDAAVHVTSNIFDDDVPSTTTSTSSSSSSGQTAVKGVSSATDVSESASHVDLTP